MLLKLIGTAEQIPGPAMFDKHVVHAGKVTGHNGKTIRHRLDDDRAEAFLLRSERHDVGGAVEFPGRIGIAGETDLLSQALIGDQRVYPRLVGIIQNRADQKQNKIAMAAEQRRQLLNQEELILALADPADTNQNQGVGRQPQPCTAMAPGFEKQFRYDNPNRQEFRFPAGHETPVLVEQFFAYRDKPANGLYQSANQGPEHGAIGLENAGYAVVQRCRQKDARAGQSQI